VQVTCRVRQDAANKLVQLAHDADLSMNAVAAAFLERAIEEGWTVAVRHSVPQDRVIIRKAGGQADTVPPDVITG
jgi:hypothetical protein